VIPASEIIGFNYVLAPDVRGKVTVQTSGRIAQEPRKRCSASCSRSSRCRASRR